MSVVTVPVTKEVPKEAKEMVDAVKKVVKHLRAKKPIAEIALLIPDALAAVDGYDKIGEEAKSQYNDELLGYVASEMFDAFKAPVA